MFSQRLFFSGKVRGGIGNQFFQANMISQLGLQLGVAAESEPLEILRHFSVRNLRREIIRHEAPPVHIERDFFVNGNWNDVLRRIRQVLRDRKSVGVPAGVLGERFAETSSLPVYKIFRPRAETQRSIRERSRLSTIGNLVPSDELVVLSHHRGKDFHQWDASAIPSFAYYKTALELIGASNPGMTIRHDVVTDDEELPSVQGFIREGKVPRRRSTYEDFMFLSTAHIIIAPPSTFSFWAALMGSGTIVFPEEWVQSKASTCDILWSRASQNKIPGLQILLA